MNLKKTSKRGGQISFRFLTGIAAAALLPVLVWASDPSWWTSGSVKGTYATNDYAAINQGQLKNIAIKAIANLDANLPGGCGDALYALSAKISGTSANTNDYSAVNLGQVKTLIQPIFDRLLSVRYTSYPLESGTYPWIGLENSANDYALANIGQVKNLFSFDLLATGSNGLPDWWQNYYFGGTVPNANLPAPVGNGLTILQCFQQKISPVQGLQQVGYVSPNWWYICDFGATQNASYQSYVVPVSFTSGVIPYATGTACPTSCNIFNYAISQPTSGSSASAWAAGTPWFLRVASSGTAYHISGTNASGIPVYTGGLAFTNPLVAFGAQAGGSPLYTNQNYSFGVVSGGQNMNSSISGTVQDIKVDIYAQSSFTSSTIANVAPVSTQTIHLPRPGETGWDAFQLQGNQMTRTLTAGSGTFSINIQYATSGFANNVVPANYPLLITVNSNSSAYYLRFSIKGAIKDVSNNWDWMAVNNPSSPSSTGDYSVAFTTDFTAQNLQGWQSTVLDRPSFEGTVPVPAAYEGKSEQDLLNMSPIVVGTDSLPSVLTATTQAQYLQTGTNIATVSTPELVANPIIDNFVASMNNDAMALANYVQNEIGLVDGMAVPNTTGTLSYSDQSVNFGGVNRSAVGVLMEGQGSPVEQCGLLVYLLRKAGVPCAYVFGPLDQTMMLSSELSRMLRMQMNGAQDFGVTQNANGPTLIPVNYPWVAAYINGKWVHLYPWIKDTVVNEGYNLYDNLPSGYKSGAQWVRQYLFNDSKIRTDGMENYDNPGILFRQFVKNNLPSTLSIDDVGVTIYNRRNYYTDWSQFPHPWSRAAVSGTHLYKDLMAYSQSAFGSDKLFDTISVQVFSDRAHTGVYASGDPTVLSGTLYAALLHDRRFLLYHTPTGSYPNTNGTSAWGSYNMNLSLEPATAIATGTNIVSGTTPFTNTGGDPYLLNKQFSSAAISGTADNNLCMTINYVRHRAMKSGDSQAFLGLCEGEPAVDTRPLKQGDTAAICFNFGQVTHWMLESHEEKYWNAQQNPSANFDIEIAQGLPAYLMGMDYYYRAGTFIDQYQALTKMQIISTVAHGLAKLSPARISGTATLINGSLNLRYPNVDMAYNQLTWAGNGTLKPGSGNANSIGFGNLYPVFIAAGSAQEHLTIQQFFASQNNDAISTVKLLDIARKTGATILTATTYNYTDSTYGPLTVAASSSGIKVTGTAGVLCTTGTGGLIELNSVNYQALGNLQLTGTQSGSRVTHSLKDWATSQGLWTPITNALSGDSGNTSRVYITPGPVSGAYSGTGSSPQAAYYGMGALIYGSYSASALISSNMNGGYGSCNTTSIPYSPESFYYANINDSWSSGGGSGLSLDLGVNTSSGSLSSLVNIDPVYSINTFSNVASNINTATNLYVDPDLQGLLVLGNTLLMSNISSDCSTASGIISNLQLNGDNGPIQPTYYNWPQTVSDPVNSVTGEFYIDNVDLKLNGPMPLQVRRNYGSQNPYSGAFGYGWKTSLVPYLVVTSDTNQTLIYAAEMDGSVVTYRRVSPTGTRWVASGSDNLQYINPSASNPGVPANLLNNVIDKSTSASGTTYTLTGGDGSLRTFLVQSFPTSGTTPLTRLRPYLQKWQDNRGNFLTFNYGTNSTQVDYGQVTSIKASNGNYVGFMYDTFGHVTQAFTGDGSRTYYEYDSYGDLTKVTLPDASTVGYSYRHQANTNGQGYYSEHLLTEEDKPGGRVLQNTYDNFGFRRVISQKSTVQQGNLAPIQNATFRYVITGLTNNTAFTLSGSTYHTGTTLTLSGTTSGSVLNTGNVTLTSSGLLSGTMPLAASSLMSGSTTLTDVNNNTWIYTFANSKIIQTNSPPQNGGTTRQNVTQQWSAATVTPGNGAYPCSLVSTTDKRGLVTGYLYDTQGNLTQKTLTGNLKGDGVTVSATTTMAYNNATAVTLPNSSATQIPNTLASVTDPVGNTVSMTYGSTAYPYLPTAITKSNASGSISTTQLQYQTVVSGSVSSFGLLQQETSAAGSPDQAVVQMVNTARGFPVQKTELTGTNDPNVVTYYTYNLRGELTSQTDAAGRNTIFTYDPRGNLAGKMRYDELGNLTSWLFNYYNQNGELEWSQGPRFNPDDYVQKEYDAAGRLCMVSKWLTGAYSNGSGVGSNGQATTFYSYDSYGNLTQILDPRQNATTMTYDAIGEMLTRKTPYSSGTASESFTYEAGGKVATHVTVLGGTDRNVYTAGGLVQSQTTADGATKSFLYDLTGRVVKETLSNGSYWLTSYDDYNRRVTRTFYNAGGTQLATESQSCDRRGNVISKTDRAGYTYTTAYDGLNRPKQTTGPGAAAATGTSGASAQETLTHTYDACGITHTVTNALGERTVTKYDSVQRPIFVKVLNADSTVADATAYIYGADNQSVTTVLGTGTSAVWSTTYTDTFGKPVLLVHPDGTYQITVYDANENKIAFQDEVGATTYWTYDALNHLQTETLPASNPANAAVTTYAYNAAGNLITRRMTTGSSAAYVTGSCAYDIAGRKTSEKLYGTDGSVTRNYTYNYYTSGSWIGLPQSVVDPRGFTTTTTYDAWLRPATVISSGASIAQQNQTTTYAYDTRHLLTQVAQSYASGTTGPSTAVTRSYDGYGHINNETVAVSGSTVSAWSQSWDGGGRRTALNWLLSSGAGSQYGYSYNAAGLLTQVVNGGTNYTYAYGDNGLLAQRNSPWRTQVVDRDSRGRIISQQTTCWGTYFLGETMAYRGDSRLSSYITSGMVTTGTLNTYQYDARGRLLAEPYLQTSTPNTTDLPLGPQTALYAFDGSVNNITNVESGLGVRTLQYINTYAADTVQSQDKFQRPVQDNYYSGDGSNLLWQYGYDAAGNASNRSIIMNGTTYPVHTLVWDSIGQMAKVSQRSTGTSDFDWSTVYDGLGRRVQTVWQPMNNGVASGSSCYLQYYYDPQVEFLGLGINNNGSRQWSVYGPDLNGIYGGQQGVGGAESYVTEGSAPVVQDINNYFGDTVGAVYTPVGMTGAYYMYSYGLTLGAYGPQPGTGLYSDLVPQWRGRYADWTGYIWMGARYYEARSGRFLSADPLGHASSMSLYDYANGDPLNGLDPDGRFPGAPNDPLNDPLSAMMQQVQLAQHGISIEQQMQIAKIANQQEMNVVVPAIGIVGAVFLAPEVGALTTTSAGLKLLGIGAGVGATSGVGATALSDWWKGSLSSPQTYFSNGVGGAFGGITTVATGSPVAGGAVNGYASSFLDDLTNGKELNANRIAFNTGLGSFSGFVSDLFPWRASIDGVNVGSNSFAAITTQIQTKVENGTINDIALSTIGKIGVYETLTNVPRDTLYGATQSYMDNLIYGSSETGTYIQQDPVGKFIKRY